MKLPEVEQEPTPKGKRSIRWNIYGNWIGYVSGKRWKEFGCDVWAEKEAKEKAEFEAKKAFRASLKKSGFMPSF